MALTNPSMAPSQWSQAVDLSSWRLFAAHRVLFSHLKTELRFAAGNQVVGPITAATIPSCSLRANTASRS